MKRQKIFLALLVIALAISAPGFAQAAPHILSAGDVLAAVNGLRRSQGLSPYQSDGSIAAYAQQHSEYQARIDQSTHTHSDGTSSLSRGYVENVAAGHPDFLTSQVIVYEIWADAVHMKTMIGYATGSAGVGVASNGSTVYVTLNVRPGDAVVAPTLPGGTPGSGLVYTPIALVPLQTTTPRASGAVVHDVGYGQSLWAIAMAYGVPGSRIRELNGMAPGQNDIYAGQRLLIIPAGSITPPSPATEAGSVQTTPSTLLTPTRSPTRTRLPTITPTLTPAPASSGTHPIKRVDPILIGLIGMACLGLALFLISGVEVHRKV